MAITLKTLLVALGFVFSAAVNASPSMPTGAPKAQQAGECIAWYSPRLQTPPETCIDVVNMHPGLDLATFFKLNPAIHPYCDNMQIGQPVCIRAIEHNDYPKPAEPSPQPLETSPNQWEASSRPNQWEASSRPNQWETSTRPNQWGSSTRPKPQETGYSASYGGY